MNFQLNFTISEQKEKEFLNFLINDCNCDVLKGYSEDTNFKISPDVPLSLLLYLITPNECVNTLSVESINDDNINGNYGIRPFDENGDCLPLIRYERFGDLFRIYAGTASMPADIKANIKNILTKIKKGVKANASSHYRDGTPFLGITIYDVT